MTRHDSRCTAVCLLFEYSFGGDRNEILENAANERGDEISAFAKSLYNGVIDNLEAVDETVRTAVLRDAAYELKYAPEPVPIEIIANEAVEICREYGEHAMTGFVHGVIGKMVNG